MPDAMLADEWFLLEMTDDGTNVSLTITDEADPLNTITILAVHTEDNLINRVGMENYNPNGGSFLWDWIEVGIVPEPASMCLLGLGGLVLLRRRR
jgi:hypothetical protein